MIPADAIYHLMIWCILNVNRSTYSCYINYINIKSFIFQVWSALISSKEMLTLKIIGHIHHRHHHHHHYLHRPSSAMLTQGQSQGLDQNQKHLEWNKIKGSNCNAMWTT